MNVQNTKKVRKHLQEKIVCLNRLLQLGKAQPSALHAGTDHLLSNLKEMAKLIHKVDGIDRTLKPLDAQLTAGEREQFRPESREIKTILHQLMTLEKKSIVQARDKMSGLRREITRRRKGHRVVKQYTQSRSAAASRFLDLREE